METSRTRDPYQNPLTDDVHGFADGRTMHVLTRQGNIVHVASHRENDAGTSSAKRRYSLEIFARMARKGFLIRRGDS
ncbi:hypothetical protein RKE25_22735 (plasmid) [Dyella sp. BiH032]|uniref:hypothetical protein n=1 Tax=Dyella sp. BiH032 TaxID=3075430 RepID=UPI0028931897|nr:hypothetical protein [Dyella sp. BiH032]WNL48352.1 hypothetical protein RKE25_22735 [Dyella sp. BiH032]